MYGVCFVSVSLTCTPETLASRIEQDVISGLRDKSAIQRSLSYLPLYESVDSIKLDTTELSPAEAAEQIILTGDSL